jgi:hypothetical protein
VDAKVKQIKIRLVTLLGSDIRAQALLKLPDYNLYLVKTNNKAEIIKIPANKTVKIERADTKTQL